MLPSRAAHRAVAPLLAAAGPFTSPALGAFAAQPPAQATDPAGLRFLEQVSARLAETELIVEDSAFKAVPARLAGAFLRLTEAAGNETVHASHQGLGDMIAAYRGTVTLALSRFCEQGLVRPGRRSVEILDRVGPEQAARRSSGMCAPPDRGYRGRSSDPPHRSRWSSGPSWPCFGRAGSATPAAGGGPGAGRPSRCLAGGARAGDQGGSARGAPGLRRCAPQTRSGRP